MATTKTKGETAEAFILATLIRAGYQVSIPWGESSRYDLVVDDGEALLRVQCKVGRLRKDVIQFSACSVDRGTKIRSDYRGDADLFAVYCFENCRTFLVPVTEVGKAMAHLRIRPTRNGQNAGIRWAEDYEVRTLPQLRGVVASDS